MDETRVKTARVKTSEGWVSFTRQFDDIESVVVSESNALVIRKPNGDAAAIFNPLGWSHIEIEWEPADADS